MKHFAYLAPEPVIVSPLSVGATMSAPVTLHAVVTIETKTVASSGESYPAFNAWPTEEMLRKPRVEGGFLAFRYVGKEANRYFGDYDNPACPDHSDHAVGAQPRLLPGNSWTDPDGTQVNVVGINEFVRLGEKNA